MSSSFIQQKSFVASQTLWYPIEPSKVRLGLILFSSNVSDVIHLRPPKSADNFRKRVTHLNHPLDGSSIYLALRELRRLFVNEGRKHSKKVGVLITDGRSRRLWNTFKEARLLRMTGIDMIAIGVGNRISEVELNGLTSDRDMLIRINSFDELFMLSEEIHRLVCPREYDELFMLSEEIHRLVCPREYDELFMLSEEIHRLVCPREYDELFMLSEEIHRLVCPREYDELFMLSEEIHRLVCTREYDELFMLSEEIH